MVWQEDNAVFCSPEKVFLESVESDCIYIMHIDVTCLVYQKLSVQTLDSCFSLDVLHVDFYFLISVLFHFSHPGFQTTRTTTSSTWRGRVSPSWRRERVATWETARWIVLDPSLTLLTARGSRIKGRSLSGSSPTSPLECRESQQAEFSHWCK